MADRTTYEVRTPKSDVQLLTAKLTGAGAADMTNDEAANMGGGEVASATRTGAGTFNLVFRRVYPELKAIVGAVVWGSTHGLRARITAIDVTAGTATVVLETPDATQASEAATMVATDPTTGDHLHLSWLVRNSGFNA